MAVWHYLCPGSNQVFPDTLPPYKSFYTNLENNHDIEENAEILIRVQVFHIRNVCIEMSSTYSSEKDYWNTHFIVQMMFLQE